MTIHFLKKNPTTMKNEPSSLFISLKRLRTFKARWRGKS